MTDPRLEVVTREMFERRDKAAFGEWGDPVEGPSDEEKKWFRDDAQAFLAAVDAAAKTDTWTVFGTWQMDEPVAELAVIGDHEDNRPEVFDGEGQPWATTVEADNADEAKQIAVFEMNESL